MLHNTWISNMQIANAWEIRNNFLCCDPYEFVSKEYQYMSKNSKLRCQKLYKTNKWCDKEDIQDRVQQSSVDPETYNQINEALQPNQDKEEKSNFWNLLSSKEQNEIDSWWNSLWFKDIQFSPCLIWKLTG